VTITEQLESGLKKESPVSEPVKQTSSHSEASSSISGGSSFYNEETEDGTYRFVARERPFPPEMMMYFVKN